MKSRVLIKNLGNHKQEGIPCYIAGRLVQASAATLTIEDYTDRRTFGYPNKNPNVSRLRVGDIIGLSLEFINLAWRVTDHQVLTPCVLQNDQQRQWMKRWFRQSNHKRKLLKLRSDLKQAVRKYFLRHDFLEIDTPSLVACPGMEANLKGFETTWNAPDNSWSKKMFLPTSPEFQLKKMLSLGYEKMFEFSRSFRNGEISNHHQPEFTMLEWYRAYEGYERVMEDIENMVCRAAGEVLGSEQLFYRGKTIDLRPPWNRISVREIFIETFKIDLDNIKNGQEFARAANENGFNYVHENESFDDVFFKLFLTEIELKLGWEKPVILYDYPMEMAALSRKKPGHPRYCERFEVYVAGVELANAFGELTNANEQVMRFNDFIEESQTAKGYYYLPDEEFIDALKFGMPPSAGIALGFDRLAMLFANETALDSVCVFPHSTPFEEDH